MKKATALNILINTNKISKRQKPLGVQPNKLRATENEAYKLYENTCNNADVSKK